MTEHADQLPGVGRRVVDAIQHDVLDCDLAAVVAADIALAGVHQLADRVFAVDRHQFVAQRVGGRVQRHRQADLADLGQLVERRHDAGGAQRHPAFGQAVGVIVKHQVDGGDHVVEIQQRFAHAHEHHVGDRTDAEFALRHPKLADDFGGAQVAIETLAGGRAERAFQRAADL